MTFRERTLGIFRHQPVDNIVYQPRIEHWYEYNRSRGTLPARYRDMELLDVYDGLGCSIRPYHYFNECLRIQDAQDVRLEITTEGDLDLVTLHTPAGNLVSRNRRTGLAFHTEEYPVKTDTDADVMEYILRSRKVWFDMDLFNQRDSMVGDRCAPMVYLPRVNMLRILLEFVGWEQTVYALADNRDLITRLVRVINETDTAILEAIAASPVELINFGDNVDEYLVSPPLFQEFVLPEYQRRTALLHAAGKFTFSHYDGNVKHLLKYTRQTGLDGLEALTPQPQGDLTLEEMKGALGDDLILLDGIPMTSFLPDSDYQEFERTTRRVIEMFSPNLILGISDEPSPVCDIERVRRVGEIVAEYAH